MKIVVCIKQVPDTIEVKIDPKTNTIIREGVASIVNPFDMYAVEEALRIKEKYSGKTIVVTMGPPQAESALREVLSLGIDEAVHLSDRAFAGSDTWATSLVLARAVEKIGDVDMVICGRQSSDGDTAQVGPGAAAHLNWPQATYVRRIDSIDTEEKSAVFERLVEDGYELVKVKLPCLISVVKEINEPRMPSLKGKMRARKQEIPVWGIKELGLKDSDVGVDGSPTRVVKIFSPPTRKTGIIIEGNPEEAAGKLANELKKHILSS